MKKEVKDESRKPYLGRTFIFSRAQYIYSLGNRDYLHKWVDRPLFLNPNIDAGKPSLVLMSNASYSRSKNIMEEYGLDGFAFFPQTTRRALFSEYSKKMPRNGTSTLYELLVDNQSISQIEAVKLALLDPNSFRLGNRVILTSYQADKIKFSEWSKILSQLHRRFGNSFLFLPDITYFGGKSINFWKGKFYQNAISTKDILNIKQYLRDWLHISDGLYFGGVAMCSTPEKKFDGDFYQNFVIRIMKSVLSESSFQNKLFGLSAILGHENCTRIGYMLNSDGTKTFRKSIEIAIQAHPDLINIPEWDEENENTSLRPTVYNGLSSMRISRYYTSKIKGIPLTALKDDNIRIPDLIVSSRKTLTLGEKIDIELLNVPDNDQSNVYTAILELKDLSGKIIYSSPSLLFHANKMEDHTISLPSEDFSSFSILIPQIIIKYNDTTTIVSDGLHYVELRSTWNWDYKWVKQSIRDIIHPSQVKLNIDRPNGSGMRTAHAIFDANEPLAFVEILDDDDVAYSYNPNEIDHENDNQVIIKFSWMAMGGYLEGQKLSGYISLKHSTGRWIIPSNSQIKPSNIRGMSFSFDGLKAFKNLRQWISIAIPKSQINGASFNIHIPNLFFGSISVKEILEKSLYGIPGPRGLNVVISHNVTQNEVPNILNQKKVNFSIPIKPSLNGSIICLQAIGISGHEYRSKPISLFDSSSTYSNITVFSDTKNAPVNLTINSNRVPNIQYDCTPDHGSILYAGDTKRPFNAILGGYFAQATGRGGGGGGDDIPFINPQNYPSFAQKTAPSWEKNDKGSYSLSFDGKGTFISLPQGVIPTRSAFCIDMNIKPTSLRGKQVIIKNENYAPGSITIYLDNDKIKINYKGEHTNVTALDSGLRLLVDKWSHLVIRYNLENIQISVNSQNSGLLSVKGPGLYTTSSSVGGFNTSWFVGQITDLKISHQTK